MIPNELDVHWTHDKMRVVLPVWRDRSPLWFAMAIAWAALVVWLGAAYLLGVFAVVWTTLPDRRRVVLELDAQHLVLRHRVLFRERVERLPVHTLVLWVRDTDSALVLNVPDHIRFVLASGDQVFTYRWTGSRESLLWLRDQIQLAHDRAVAPAALPPPPPELTRLRRVAQPDQSPANTTSGSSVTPV